jgi:hypothetical protein
MILTPVFNRELMFFKLTNPKEAKSWLTKDKFSNNITRSKWIVGIVSNRIVVSKFKGDSLVMIRPVFPYPSIAVNKGQGDTNDQKSFLPSG